MRKITMKMTKSKPRVGRHVVAFAALLATAAPLFVGAPANAFQVLVAGAPLTGGDADGVYLCDTETDLCTEFIPNIDNIPFPVVNGPDGIYVGQFQSTIVQHYDLKGVLQKEILPLPAGLSGFPTRSTSRPSTRWALIPHCA